MRAGVRKAGPLSKKTPPFITPLTAPNRRAPNQGAATMHPPPTSYYYYIIIIIILNIKQKHSEHKILNLHANAMHPNSRSRSLFLDSLSFFPKNYYYYYYYYYHTILLLILCPVQYY